MVKSFNSIKIINHSKSKCENNRIIIKSQIGRVLITKREISLKSTRINYCQIKWLRI